MSLRTRAITWRRAQDPDPVVFAIGCMLVEPEKTIHTYRTIRDKIRRLVDGEVWEIFGFDEERVYVFSDLLAFMVGRVNPTEAKILELCVVGNYNEERNFFKHAHDIITGIIELEGERVMPEQKFRHNDEPGEELIQTVLPTAIGLY